MARKNNLKSWFYPVINSKKAMALINNVIKTTFVNEGPLAQKLESKISKICRRKYCAVTSSGSTALVTALIALGIKKNDYVFVPGFSFIATVNAIKIIGAKPVWVDIEKNTMCICHKDLEKKIILNKNKKIKLCVCVEVNGYSPNYKKILLLCKKYNLKILTDSAESLGSKYYSKPLGSIGDMSVLSFSPNKIFTTGQGGAVLTNNKMLYNRSLAIKYQGNHKRGDGGSDSYYMVGLNFKMSDVNAALGLAQIGSIFKRLKNTEKNYLKYKTILESKNIFFPKIQKGGKRLWVDCYIINNRLKFIKSLKKKNIAYRKFWLPMNEQISMESLTNLKNVSYVSKKGIWLASNFNITTKDINEAYK